MVTVNNKFTELVKEKAVEIKNTIKQHVVSVSSETLGWLGIILIHLATIPTLIAVLTGLTDNTPPVDLVLAMWAGLVLFFVKAAISRDLLNILTIGIGFMIQATLLALILFK